MVLFFIFFLQSKISQDQAGLCGRKWETMEKNWQIYAGDILINLNSEIWLAKPMKLLCMRICIIHSNSTKQQLKQLIESSVKFLVRDLRPSNLICILTFALILNFSFLQLWDLTVIAVRYHCLVIASYWCRSCLLCNLSMYN